MMVTGRTPFGDCSALDCYLKKVRNDLPPPREVVPVLSERTDWAIRRAMSPNPDQRPATCREFVEDLYGKSTRPMTPAEKAAVESDLWYLVYRDELGQPHTVKGGTEGIRRALRDGLLGDAATMTACRSKQGPFVDLKSFPEFRDLLIAPEALPPVNKQTPARPVTVAKATPPPLPTPPVARTKTKVDEPPPPDPMAWRRGKVPPRLEIGGPRSRGFDIAMWLLVLGLALATAFAVYRFFPPG
jgi:hypothetical protein